MAKLLSVVVSYDQLTRQLVTTVTLNGFVVQLPAAPPIVSLQTDTLQIFRETMMTSVDQDYVVKSVSRALLAANVQLGEWNAAALTSDKADQLLAASINPVQVFEDTLNPPTETP